MMNDMMGGGTMMWGMGLFGLLIIVVLVLAAIALARYVFHAVKSAVSESAAVLAVLLAR